MFMKFQTYIVSGFSHVFQFQSEDSNLVFLSFLLFLGDSFDKRSFFLDVLYSKRWSYPNYRASVKRISSRLK